MKIIALFAAVFMAVLFVLAPGHQAAAANPTTINFQGKIVNSDGTNVTNNTYSIVFRIYNTASPVMTTSCTSTASCLWQETQASVTVTNGVFQVELGSSCALTSTSCNNSTSGGIPSNWSSSSLYLTMQFNGDTSGSNGGFMSPTIHLTSVPFAFNADNLGGLAASNFVQLAQGVQTDTSTSNPSIYVNKNNASGTPNILELQKAGNDVLVVNNSGNLVLGKAGGGSINGTLVFNNTAGSNTVTLAAQGSNPSSSVSIFLPVAGATGTQCLQSTSGSTSTSTTLTFSSCGGGSSTLASAYNSSGTSGNTITYTTAGGGIVIQDASTPLTGNLLTLQNNGATFNYLTFSLSSGVPHLKIYGSSSTNYADIYYDSGTSSAIFVASSGTTVVGSGSGSISITAGSSSAVTVTGHAASSFSTDSGSLTLQATAAAASLILDAGTSGNGTVTVGNSTASTISIGSNSASHTIAVGSTTGGTTTINAGSGGVILDSSANNSVLVGTTNNETVTIGATSNTHTLTLGQSTAGETISIGNGNVATGNTNTINIGATATSTGKDVVTIGSTVAASSTTIQGGTGDITLNTSSGNTVQIGSGSTDTNIVLFQLDSDSNFSSDEGTCNTTTNQGAIYYNTSTNAIRGCINSAWEDIVSTGALGLQLFGVVPDSGTTPGDWIGITGTNPSTGPCKVYMGSTTSTIRWTGCTAYSGGRKVVIAAQGTNQSVTITSGDWTHVCVNSTTGAVQLLLGTSETNNLPAFSASAPVLCLADLSANGTKITGIYDTRTFTTTTKEIVNNITTAAALGMIAQQTTTAGSVTRTAATAGLAELRGVYVVTAGGTTANTMNAIIATAGPAYVKNVTTGAVQAFIESGSTTAGYSLTTTTLPTAGYATLGVALSALSTTCAANADSCRTSLAVNLAIR